MKNLEAYLLPFLVAARNSDRRKSRDCLENENWRSLVCLLETLRVSMNHDW